MVMSRNGLDIAKNLRRLSNNCMYSDKYLSLSSISMDCMAVHAPIEEGRVPFRLLSYTLNTVMLVHNPIVVGNVPTSPVSCSLTLVRSVHKPMSAGIEPGKL
jgi:hypothetical protein